MAIRVVVLGSVAEQAVAGAVLAGQAAKVGLGALQQRGREGAERQRGLNNVIKGGLAGWQAGRLAGWRQAGAADTAEGSSSTHKLAGAANPDVHGELVGGAVLADSADMGPAQGREWSGSRFQRTSEATRKARQQVGRRQQQQGSLQSPCRSPCRKMQPLLTRRRRRPCTTPCGCRPRCT